MYQELNAHAAIVLLIELFLFFVLIPYCFLTRHFFMYFVSWMWPAHGKFEAIKDHETSKMDSEQSGTYHVFVIVQLCLLLL